MYEVGQILPEYDNRMVKAWLDAGSARPVEAAQPAPSRPTVKLATAQPGLPVDADNGRTDNLAGRIPETPERKRRRKAAK